MGNLISQSPTNNSATPIGIELFGPAQATVPADNQVARNVIGLAWNPATSSFAPAAQSTGILVNNSANNQIGSTLAKAQTAAPRAT